MSHVFVIRSLNIGGAERTLVNLANYFSSLGGKVSLIVFDSRGYLRDQLNPEVEVLVFPQNIFGFLYLGRFLKKNPETLVVSFLFYSNFKVALLKKLGLIKNLIIATEHSSPKKYANNGTVRSRLRKLLGRFAFSAVNRFYVVSPSIKDDVTEVFSIKENVISIVPNPFDPKFLNKKAQDFLPGYVNEFIQGRSVVCAVGRLVFDKGIDILIEAVVKTKTDFVLIIVGDGDERSDIENRIIIRNLSHRVLLVGFEENPWKYIAKSELLIVPSRSEGFGNVIVEAAILNIPVISTDCVGPRYIFSEKDHEKLVPIESPMLLARAIDSHMGGLTDFSAIPDFKDFLIDSVSDKYEI